MFVTIRKYSGTGDAKEINRIAMAEILPVLRKVPGFKSYVTIDTGNHTVASIGMFDNKASADAANLSARDVVKKHMVKLLPNPPEITLGEVLGEAK
jgi:hypothetical protein